jgi:hypothetical protein
MIWEKLDDLGDMGGSAIHISGSLPDRLIDLFHVLKDVAICLSG